MQNEKKALSIYSFAKSLVIIQVQESVSNQHVSLFISIALERSLWKPTHREYYNSKRLLKEIKCDMIYLRLKD